MNGELLQPKVQYGYAKCAQKIGAHFSVYRSPTLINPLAPLNNVGRLKMSANVSWSYMNSNRYGKAVWNLIIDTTTYPNYRVPDLEPNGCLNYDDPITMALGDADDYYRTVVGVLQTSYQIPVSAQVGDYLVPWAVNNPPSGNLIQDDSIYFLAAQQYLLPPLGVKCNRTIKIIRPTFGLDSPGFLGYSEYLPATSLLIADGMPASVLEMGKGQSAVTKLPTDTNEPNWIILIPNLGGSIIRIDDIVIDDENQNYVVSDNELTELGWRIIAQQVVNSR